MARKFSLANSAPSKTAGLSAAAAAAKLAQKAKPVQPGNDLSATQNNWPQDDPTKKGFAADPGLGTTFTPPNDQTQGGGEDVTANPAKAGQSQDDDDGRKPDPDIANSWKALRATMRNAKDALGHGSEKRYSVVKDSPFNRENAKEFIGHAFLHGHEPSYTGVDEPVESSKLKPGTMRWDSVDQFKGFHNLKNSSTAYTDQIRALRNSMNPEFHPASEVQVCKLLCNSALLNDMSDADKDAAYISALDAYRAGRDLTEQEQAVLGEAMAEDGLATPVVELAFADDGDDDQDEDDNDCNCGCGCSFNYGDRPEVCMGSVACPQCGAVCSQPDDADEKSDSPDLMNAKISSYQSLIQSIRNSGTSEGVKKGWETRRGVGYDNTERAARPARKAIGTTASGKSVPHVNDKVYQMVEPRAKWNRRVSPMNSDFEGGKILRERLREDGWTKQDHDEAAQMHLDKARAASKKWGKVADEAAQATYGRPFEPTDYRVSGIADDKFSDAHKDALREASKSKSEETSAAYAHFIAAGHRNLEPIREASHGLKDKISDKIKNSSTHQPDESKISSHAKDSFINKPDEKTVTKEGHLKPIAQPEAPKTIPAIPQLPTEPPQPAPALPPQNKPLENSEISSTEKKGEPVLNHAAGSKWPVGKTRSGKSIKHTSHETYSKAELRKGHEGEISPLGDAFTGAAMLKERLPDWTPEEHTDAAAAHLRKAQEAAGKVQEVQNSVAELDKPQPEGADKQKLKEKRFKLDEQATGHKKQFADSMAAASAHWQATGANTPVDADLLLQSNGSSLENVDDGKTAVKKGEEELLNGVPIEMVGKMLNAKFSPEPLVHIASYGVHPHEASGLQQVIDEPAVDAMIESFNKAKLEKGDAYVQADHDHQSDVSENTAADGWVTDLVKKPDGLYGAVKWTGDGEKLVGDGVYRWISPVWQKNESEDLGNNKIRPQILRKISLTNSPNLTGLRAVSH